MKSLPPPILCSPEQSFSAIRFQKWVVYLKNLLSWRVDAKISALGVGPVSHSRDIVPLSCYNLINPSCDVICKSNVSDVRYLEEYTYLDLLLNNSSGKRAVVCGTRTLAFEGGAYGSDWILSSDNENVAKFHTPGISLSTRESNPVSPYRRHRAFHPVSSIQFLVRVACRDLDLAALDLLQMGFAFEL